RAVAGTEITSGDHAITILYLNVRATEKRWVQVREPAFRGSAAVGFDGDQLVGTLPGRLHIPGRTHPGLECAFTVEPLEFSATAGKLPGSFDRHLGAARCDLALERAPVAVALTVDL